MNASDREQIALWVEKQLDDSLEAAEFDQLQKMLMEQPEAREFYLDLMREYTLSSSQHSAEQSELRRSSSETTR